MQTGPHFVWIYINLNTIAQHNLEPVIHVYIMINIDHQYVILI